MLNLTPLSRSRTRIRQEDMRLLISNVLVVAATQGEPPTLQTGLEEAMFNVSILHIAKRGHLAVVVDANGKLLGESSKLRNIAEGFAKLRTRLNQAG